MQRRIVTAERDQSQLVGDLSCGSLHPARSSGQTSVLFGLATRQYRLQRSDLRKIPRITFGCATLTQQRSMHCGPAFESRFDGFEPRTVKQAHECRRRDLLAPGEWRTADDSRNVGIAARQLPQESQPGRLQLPEFTGDDRLPGQDVLLPPVTQQPGPPGIVVFPK